MLAEVFSNTPQPTPSTAEQGVGSLEKLLKLLNLFDLKQELNQPVSPINGLEDLQNKTDLTLQTLEETFEKISEQCSHWTINSLFGSTVVASYLEKLIQKNNHKFIPQKFQKTTEKWQLHKFSHSLMAEIAVGMSLNFLVLFASIHPVLTGIGIISNAFLETLVQHALNIISVQSFSVFTALIRQRLTEYPEFSNFIPEYRTYTNFFRVHQYQVNLEIINSQDTFKVFKLIHTFSRVTNRRALLKELMRILAKDEIFQARLQRKLSKLGCIFLKAIQELTG